MCGANMRYCGNTRITVVSSEDIRIYCRYTTISMGSLGNTLIAQGQQESHQEQWHKGTSGANRRNYIVILGCHCSHQDILLWPYGTSGATRRYCSDTRIPVKPSGYTLATLVEPTGGTVMTLGTSVATRIYFSDTRVPGNTLVTVVYLWSQQEIQ